MILILKLKASNLQAKTRIHKNWIKRWYLLKLALADHRIDKESEKAADMCQKQNQALLQEKIQNLLCHVPFDVVTQTTC